MTDTSDSNKKRKKIIVIGGVVLLFAVMIFFIVRKGVFLFDPSAEEGKLQMETGKEKAETKGFHFKILTSPYFETGSSQGELMITNPSDNKYKTSVIITLNENDQEVYASEILEPGDRVRFATLQGSLPKGEYPATAMFTILDLQTGERVGAVAAKLNITIGN